MAHMFLLIVLLLACLLLRVSAGSTSMQLKTLADLFLALPPSIAYSSGARFPICKQIPVKSVSEVIRKYSHVGLSCASSFLHSASILSRAGAPTLQAFTTSGNALIELPLFDPQGDAILFPIPAPEASFAFEDKDIMDFTPATKYVFDRPVYIRMFKDLNASSKWYFFGHCLAPPYFQVAAELDGDSLVQQGSVGIAMRVERVDIEQRIIDGDPFGEEVAVINCVAAFRFEIAEVVSTFPYPVVRVSEYCDESGWEDVSKLEADLQTAIKSLIKKQRSQRQRDRLSKWLNRFKALLSLRPKSRESVTDIDEVEPQRNDSSQSSKESTTLLEAHGQELLNVHKRAVLNNMYSDKRERWEVFSLCASSLMQLPQDIALQCVVTQSAEVRFQLLLDHLQPVLMRMGALKAINDALVDSNVTADLGPARKSKADVIAEIASSIEQSMSSTGSKTGVSVGGSARQSLLGGTTTFVPVDIPVGSPEDLEVGELPDGKRIEFWYNEEYRWIKATVRRKVRSANGDGVLHILYFDVFDREEDVELVWWQFRELMD